MTEAVAPVAARWRSTLVASAAIFLGTIALFLPTAQGMVHVWYNFETYTHGFLILPISLWLVWHKRRHLAAFTPQPSAPFLIAVFGSLALWALARLSGVLVVEQFAFVAVLIGALAAVLGWQITRFLAFPLLFLLFAVPMGQDLIPPMMEFTASFTVGALKLTGIPVYRDGLWFSLPTGNWSVVEACSGVRYLIASVTLGFMYAYITYHTLWKRIVFVTLSAVVPILANGLRAYMIVMIGHLSGMEYATGVDHLIYGWVFFGVVMFILFWIGSYWQEEESPPEFVPPPRVMSHVSTGVRSLVVVLVALGGSAAAVWGVNLAESADTRMAAALAAPGAGGPWQKSDQPTAWSAAHQPTPHVIEARYQDGSREVQLFVVLYPQQRQGNEAINQANQVAADLARRTDLGNGSVALGDQVVEVNRYKAVIAAPGARGEHLVWQWYRVAGRSLTNRYEGKAWEALARLYPGRTDGAWIAITTPYDEQDAQAAEASLASFARSMAPQIDAAIDAAIGIAD